MYEVFMTFSVLKVGDEMRVCLSYSDVIQDDKNIFF